MISSLHPARLLPLAALLLAACSPRSDAPVSPQAGILAEQLDADFRVVRLEVEKLAGNVAKVYQDLDALAAKADPSRYAFAANGAFYKKEDDGGPALWISAVLPITDEVRKVAYATEAIDPELARICRDLPEVCQAYYNDRHSLNRIYPWFDTIAQYPPRMDIPTFNFYYLADAEHNPARKGVWVDEPYVDPAGRGWMVSAIAPVYSGDQLVGVPGLDVTISTIVERYFQNTSLPVVVIARDGVLVAATETAIQQLEMPPLKSHKYLETVKLDTYKPDEYNIRKSTRRSVRAMAAALLDERKAEVEVELAGRPALARAARMTELDWTIVEFLPR